MGETYSTLRKKIVGYLGRNETDFTIGGVDCLAQAINNAKNFCQRVVDFEYQRAFAQVDNVSLTTGGSLLNAKLFGTSTAVAVKSVEQAWLGDATGQYPIDFLSRDDWVQRKRRLVKDGSFEESPVVRPSMVLVGTQFYIDQGADALDSTFTVYFDIVKWHPDFGNLVSGTATATEANKLVCATGGFVAAGVLPGDIVYNTTDGTSATVASVESATKLVLSGDIFVSGEAYLVGTFVQSSFLLDYCFDYMLFRSIWELNFFMKEEQRFVAADAAMEKTWKNILAWNASIVGNSVSSEQD